MENIVKKGKIIYEKCKLLVLPSETDSEIGLYNGKWWYSPFGPSTDDWVSFHLYVLSYDKIKVGDWVYSSVLGFFQYHKGCEIDITDRKVIATTNPKLQLVLSEIDSEFINSFISNDGVGFDNIYVEMEEYMTEGWIPTYNNPDNNNLDEPAELALRLKLIGNSINIKLGYDNPDAEHLQFIYDRLRFVYNENPNIDYMIRLKKIIDKQ